MFRQIIFGFWVGLPVSLAVGLYGVVMGVGAAAQNITWAELLLKSFAVFAGASQIVVVESWGSPIWVLLLATAAVNLRYLMVGLTLRPVLDAASWPLRLTSLWYAADENWALTLAQRAKDARIGAAFLLGSGLAVLTCWQIGGQVGLAVGQALPNPQTTILTYGLDFAFPAIFLALALSFVKTPWDWLPVAVAGGISIAAYLAIPDTSDYHDLYIVIGAVAGCAVAALIYQPGFMDAEDQEALK